MKERAKKRPEKVADYSGTLFIDATDKTQIFTHAKHSAFIVLFLIPLNHIVGVCLDNCAGDRK